MSDDRETKLNAILAKIDRGEFITKDERMEILGEEALRSRKRILDAMQARRDQHDNVVRYTQGAHDAVGEAVTLLLAEMMCISAAHSERRQQLEQRVLHLEGAIGKAKTGRRK